MKSKELYVELINQIVLRQRSGQSYKYWDEHSGINNCNAE